MKKILALFLLIQIQASQAGQPPNYIVSHSDTTFDFITHIYEGSDFYFLRKWGGCSTTGYTVEPHAQFEIVGNDITVLYRHGLGGSTICVSPWPLVYGSVIGIPGLPEGEYNISYYIVPYEDAFPPNEVDLPNYFIENITFGVLALVQVDLLSPWSLFSLVLFIFVVGLTVINRKAETNKLRR